MLERLLGPHWDGIAWYAASMLTAISAAFNIVLLSMSRNRKHDEARKKYLWYVVAIAVWSANVFIFSISSTWGVSYVACQLLHLGAIAIPILLLDFVQKFYGYKSGWDRFEKVVGYALSIAFAGVLVAKPDWMISGLVPKRGFPFFLNPGPLYLPWMIVFFYFVLSSHAKVLLSFFSMKGEERRQAAYFVIPSLIAYTGCIGYFLPVYDIFIFPYPIGCFGSMTLPFIFGYMIVRYKLMGVDVFIKKTIVFAGLFGFVYGITAAFTYLGQQYFEKQLGWPVWTAMIPSIVLIVLVLRPLENWLVNVTDRYLFQKDYDHLELIRLFTTEILTIFDQDKVAQHTVKALDNIIKLESCSVVMKEPASERFKVISAYGFKTEVVSFEPDHPLIQQLQRSQNALRAEEVIAGTERDRKVLDACEGINAEIIVPIIFQKELIGFMSLGAKKSGEDYKQSDIDVLMSLARTEAIAISNARLFAQLAETQAEAAQNEKMAVIGTLAAGINHEICNPLGIVRGQCEMFLLNYRDGIYGQIPDKQVLEQAVTIFGKIIKETDRATGITKRLSTFAKPNKHFQVTEVDVAKELTEVLAILEHDLRLDNIEIKIELPQDFPRVLADRKEMQEVIFNILRNAAQAVRASSGKIVIDGKRNGTRAMVMIRDNGHGIPEDKMEKIFHPFFTTKDPGKGTGLGLFIVKQIVERNEGSISVKSEIGKGTEFTLAFRLAKEAAHV